MHVDISSIYGEPEKYCLRCMLTQFLGSNEPTKETPIFELVMTNKESLKPYIYIYQYSRTRRWRKFQKGKIYNSKEHVPIESFVTTLID